VITGASALLCTLPTAGWLLAERGYDADWFRKVLKDEGIMACITGRKSFSREVEYDKKRYHRRNRIENMFGLLEVWRQVATRYDRCPETFFSTIALAATVLVWF
jgi:transposase